VLTLSPVLHQRRATRSVTEYRPERGAGTAWSGAYHDEARELRAFDRIREEPARGKQQRRRPGKEVNGNVARPERAPGAAGRRKGKRGVAPGQELPSVRTWFAGDSREGGTSTGRGGYGNNNPAGGNRRGGKPGAKPAEGRGAGNPYGGFAGGGNRGRSSGGNRQGQGQGQGGRPQARGGNRPQGQGGGRPHGGGGGGGRGGNRGGNR
jgi:23S rRNA pseudouridine2605 synthase